MGEVDAVAVVGEPIVWGIGAIVLALLVFTDSWARSLVTVAHEGGHIVVGILTFQSPGAFRLEDGGGGATAMPKLGWGVGSILSVFAGYPMPCVLGLGGAALVADGRLQAVLWISVVLLLASFLKAGNGLSVLVTALALGGVVWVQLDGSLQLQAGVAVGMVWWLLIGGALYSSIRLSRGDGSDAALLARWLLLPRLFWHGVWAAIGVACLWVGGGMLVNP
jgi:hypothetical protein